jgi:hypothetical protein
MFDDPAQDLTLFGQQHVQLRLQGVLLLPDLANLGFDAVVLFLVVFVHMTSRGPSKMATARLLQIVNQ